MCGRFTLRSPANILADYFGLDSLSEMVPRYNIAPTQPVGTIDVDGAKDGRRQWRERRWGLIPHWADDAKIGSRMINARAETVDSLPAFRDSFRQRRCVVPADGFYEWQRIDDGGGGRSSNRRQPYFLHLADEQPFAIAGLWASWRNRRKDTRVESCTLITVPANERVAEIHGRMPAILERQSIEAWLNPETPSSTLLDLLQPCRADRIETRPVSALVNSPHNESAACVDSVTAAPRPLRLFD